MCHGRTGFHQFLFKIHNLMRQIGVERVSSALKSQGESLVDPKVWESRQLTAQSAGFTRRPTMGNGVCSRKQRKIFQSLLLITVIFGVIYGGMMSFEMHKQLKRTEALSLKYQQHQESLSAQLQVVYEHRSRLEKSLQKERVEHKKAKEDFLLFKLEAQQSLSKEKQDGQNKFNSLHSQHQMLKNQHEDLKKQYYELQEQQQAQSQDHSKVLDEHQQKFDQLQETKDVEIAKLKGNVYNLREENKQLRKAHQEIHVQLQDTRLQHKDLKAAHEQLVLTLEDHKSALAAAQVQVDEFKHLKETLNKMPSLRQPAERQPPTVGLHAQPARRDHVALPAQRHAAEARDEEKPEGKEVEVKKVEQGTDDVEPNKIQHEQDEDLDRNHPDEDLDRNHPDEDLDRNHPDEDLDRNHPDEDLERNHPDENAVERERLLAERVEQEKVQHKHLQKEQQVQNEHNDRLRLQKEQQVQNEHNDRLRLQKEQQVQNEHNDRLHLQKEQQVQNEQNDRLHLQKEQQVQKEQNDRLRLQKEQQVQNEQNDRLRLQREREEQHHRELREQQLQEDQLRIKEQYNMDSEIVRGDEGKPAEGEAEADGPHEEGQRFDGDQHLHQDEHHLEAEVDPADDPNNQGEDEFEEAEQQVREEEAEEEQALPGHADVRSQRRHRPDVDEHLVMAGNPDQQEDNLEEQYQEEGDEEEQKAEEVGEEEADHYNEENGEQDDAREQEMGPEDRQIAKEEENYEEEEEEPEEDTKRRAEM